MVCHVSLQEPHATYMATPTYTCYHHFCFYVTPSLYSRGLSAILQDIITLLVPPKKTGFGWD